jgi:hypothetical protein
MGGAGSNLLAVFSFNRTRMRLMVARLKPIVCAIRTPVQRRASTRVTSSGLVGWRSRCGRELRSWNPFDTALAIAANPLARTLLAEPVLGCRLAQRQPTLHHTPAKNLSTTPRHPGMIVIVHLTSQVTAYSSQSASSFSVRWTTTYCNFTPKTSIDLFEGLSSEQEESWKTAVDRIEKLLRE